MHNCTVCKKEIPILSMTAIILQTIAPGSMKPVTKAVFCGKECCDKYEAENKEKK